MYHPFSYLTYILKQEKIMIEAFEDNIWAVKSDCIKRNFTVLVKQQATPTLASTVSCIRLSLCNP